MSGICAKPRPMDIFFYKIAFELGAQLYGLMFRGIPVGPGLALFADLRFPTSMAVWLYTLTELAVGVYIGLTLGYMVGVSSFWTHEIRTVSWALYSAQTLLGGISMPLDVLPGRLEMLAKASPALIWHTIRPVSGWAFRGRHQL